MAFDAYSVAVKLSLVSNVGAGLLSLSKNLQSTHMDAKELENRLGSIGKRLELGNSMFAGGKAIATMFKTPVEKAIEYQRELSKLKQMGLGDAQIQDAQKFVQATQIIGTSVMDRMKLFVETQGAFRESGMAGPKALEAAKTMTPILGAYQTAVQTLDGDKRATAESGMMALNRLVDQMGGVHDPRRAAAIVDSAFKSVQATGKMITPEQIGRFRSSGGAAVANYTDKALFAGLEPIMGELKESTMGMGLRTAYARMQGHIKPPNQLVGEAMRLGIWDKKEVVFNSMGGIQKLKGNPLKGEYSGLMNSDPVAFAEKMLAVYKAHGITQQSDISRENMMLFGSNGAKFYDLMMRQMPKLKSSEGAFGVAHGIGATNKDNANSPQMAILQFDKAIDGLCLSIGNDLLPMITPLVGRMTELAVELGKHPDLIRNFTFALVGLSASLATGGLINMVWGAGNGFLLLYDVLKGGRIASAILSWTALIGKVLLTGLRAIPVVGWVVMAVTLGIYLWRNWGAVWKGTKAVFGFISDGVGALWSGISAAFSAGYGVIKGFVGWFFEQWAWLIGKVKGFFSIGDKPAASHSTAPVPPKVQPVFHFHVSVPVDGKKVAEVVTKYQAQFASRAPTGGSSVDPAMNHIFPGMYSGVFGGG
ncbi:hypothetical protein [Paludibacterium yongneupense]|uniref:hypothetical protein n=1 Tax=Paludibacterium yongneupense TaxID=400061 RepID=UPI000424EF08|nr:hypothetical protein [Paludibacterium yongneupense]